MSTLTTKNIPFKNIIQGSIAGGTNATFNNLNNLKEVNANKIANTNNQVLFSTSIVKFYNPDLPNIPQNSEFVASYLRVVTKKSTNNINYKLCLSLSEEDLTIDYPTGPIFDNWTVGGTCNLNGTLNNLPPVQCVRQNANVTQNYDKTINSSLVNILNNYKVYLVYGLDTADSSTINTLNIVDVYYHLEYYEADFSMTVQRNDDKYRTGEETTFDILLENNNQIVTEQEVRIDIPSGVVITEFVQKHYESGNWVTDANPTIIHYGPYAIWKTGNFGSRQDEIYTKKSLMIKFKYNRSGVKTFNFNIHDENSQFKIYVAKNPKIKGFIKNNRTNDRIARVSNVYLYEKINNGDWNEVSNTTSDSSGNFIFNNYTMTDYGNHKFYTLIEDFSDYEELQSNIIEYNIEKKPVILTYVINEGVSIVATLKDGLIDTPIKNAEMQFHIVYTFQSQHQIWEDEWSGILTTNDNGECVCNEYGQISQFAIEIKKCYITFVGNDVYQNKTVYPIGG